MGAMKNETKKIISTIEQRAARELRRQIEEEFDSHTLPCERYLTEVYYTIGGITIYQVG